MDRRTSPMSGTGLEMAESQTWVSQDLPSKCSETDEGQISHNNFCWWAEWNQDHMEAYKACCGQLHWDMMRGDVTEDGAFESHQGDRRRDIQEERAVLTKAWKLKAVWEQREQSRSVLPGQGNQGRGWQSLLRGIKTGHGLALVVTPKYWNFILWAQGIH